MNFLFNSIFANEATDEGLIFKIYKELIQININKTTQSKNGRRPKQTFPQRRHTDGQQAQKRCSTLLIIREVQIKTTIRYHLTLVRMAIIKKSTNNKYWRGWGEKGTLLHCQWKVNWYSHNGEQLWQVRKKLKIELPYDPAIPLLGYIWKNL